MSAAGETHFSIIMFTRSAHCNAGCDLLGSARREKLKVTHGNMASVSMSRGFRLGGWYNEKCNTSQALILTHSFILSHLFSVPLIYSFFFPLFHASPWPYTIFQRGFDLVMGEQPSDRIFR